MLGLCVASRGDIDAALVHLGEAARLEPGVADHHYNLANALVERMRWAEAIEHYQEALRLQPEHAEARRKLLLVQQHVGQAPQ